MSALEDIIENEIEEAYNKGLNDAWELAKKLYLDTTCCELRKIYEVDDSYDEFGFILRKYTMQEALSKLEAYEKEIEVGDVVKVDGTNKDCGIVIAINEIEKKARLMYADTSFRVNEWYLADLKKTGKHIDISKILEQIGE